MKQRINIIKNVIAARPKNAFILFLTGFFFIQFMLVNILYAKHPLGGWVTDMGTFTTSSILFATLIILSLCLFSLWRSVSKNENVNKSMKPKLSIVKIPNGFSPIDYPQSSTKPVVSGYAIG